MAQFKIKEGSFEEMRKKMLKWLIPMAVIVLAIVVIGQKVRSRKDDADMYVLPITICVFTAFIVFSFYRLLAKQKKLFESYLLTIDDFMITRQQFNTPEISMSFNEVEEISKMKNGGFIIKGKYKGELIMVPKFMDRYDELEKMLSNIRPISENSNALKKLQYQSLIGIAAIPFMIIVMLSDNKIIVFVCGVLAIAISIWRFIRIQQSKNVDRGTKMKSYSSFIIMALVLFMMYFKLVMMAN